MAGLPPLLAIQGNLNRVITQVTFPSAPQLNVGAQNMAKSLAVLTFDGPFVEQIPTATGIVNSPLPFVMAQLVVNLLRSQNAATLWVAQLQLNATIGSLNVYPDSTTFPYFILNDCSVMDFDPGAFDGVDATTKFTLKGTFYINAQMWLAA
jgi:hypothetical protein